MVVLFYLLLNVFLIVGNLLVDMMGVRGKIVSNRDECVNFIIEIVDILLEVFLFLKEK